MYAYAAYRLGDGPDAEDATQQTFERGYQYRSSYDPDRGEPIAWLLGIARHCVDDVFKARSTHEEPAVDLPDAGDLESRAIGRLDVRQAVLSLDERSQDLIALRYGADLTARQIAEMLGERTNTIEVALHRALGRLRAELGGDAADEDAVRI